MKILLTSIVTIPIILFIVMAFIETIKYAITVKIGVKGERKKTAGLFMSELCLYIGITIWFSVISSLYTYNNDTVLIYIIYHLYGIIVIPQTIAMILNIISVIKKRKEIKFRFFLLRLLEIIIVFSISISVYLIGGDYLFTTLSTAYIMLSVPYNLLYLVCILIIGLICTEIFAEKIKIINEKH